APGLPPAPAQGAHRGRGGDLGLPHPEDGAPRGRLRAVRPPGRAGGERPRGGVPGGGRRRRFAAALRYAGRAARAEGMTALVVEDSPTMRQLVVFALRRIRGLAIVEAEDGVDALKN